MAEYVLENEVWKATVCSSGCELVSMIRKSDGREYLWCGDPKVWKRHAPVLFPLVGKYRGNTARYDGQEYHMGQHGCARDMEFDLLHHDSGRIEMKLDSSEATRDKYPFAFTLICGYELKENCLRASWRVENPDNRTMYFAIGGHPAFVADGRGSHAGCRLFFETEADCIRYHRINGEGLWMPQEYALALDADKSAVITGDMFDKDALIVEGRQTGKVSLADEERVFVEVTFEAPLFGLWSAAGKDVPYVCIEPWYGRTDAADFAGELGQRAYDNALEPGQTFAASYEMRFF